MMSAKKEYDWVEDPFKDDPDTNKGMSGRSKAFVGCGCLIAIVVMVFLMIGLFESFLGLLGG